MQNKPYIIIITGGIATGKSTVSAILREKGYRVIDSDEIVHGIYNNNLKVKQEIAEIFGASILDDKGAINRKKLGEIVFSSKDSLKKLNKIVHINVVSEINNLIKNSDDKVIFVDVPLMIEEKQNLEKYSLKYDEICLVYTDYETQVRRLLDRDKRGHENSKKIIDAQMCIEEKRKFADYIIENEGTKEDLKKSLVDYLDTLKSRIS